MSNLDSIFKSRHYFANKGPSSQGYGFSCGHGRMWELDREESWVQKNWCFWTVVLEKTVESPLDCKEIKPVHSEDLPWDFFGGNDAEAETPVLLPGESQGRGSLRGVPSVGSHGQTQLKRLSSSGTDRSRKQTWLPKGKGVGGGMMHG